VAGEHGVHHAVEHDRGLADEDRPGLVEDAPRDRAIGRGDQAGRGGPAAGRRAGRSSATSC
jgi:hypothetical protein